MFCVGTGTVYLQNIFTLPCVRFGTNGSRVKSYAGSRYQRLRSLDGSSSLLVKSHQHLRIRPPASYLGTPMTYLENVSGRCCICRDGGKDRRLRPPSSTAPSPWPMVFRCRRRLRAIPCSIMSLVPQEWKAFRCACRSSAVYPQDRSPTDE